MSITFYYEREGPDKYIKEITVNFEARVSTPTHENSYTPATADFSLPVTPALAQWIGDTRGVLGEELRKYLVDP